MKKFFLTISMMLSVCSMMAQTDNAQDNTTANDTPAPLEQLLVYENPKILVSIGDINYIPKSVGSQVKNTAVGVVGSILSKDKYQGTEIPIEDEGMVPGVKESLQNAVGQSFRLTPVIGDFTAEQLSKQLCLKFTATITGCNTTVRVRNNCNDKYISVTAYIYLTNPKTGEVMASQQVEGYSWGSSFTSVADAQKYAIHNVGVAVINQLNAWYPLRGHMLEKGFQKGKKQKLKEIYIDLGSKNGLGTGYTCNVYTVRRIAGRIARKYIGRGKVTEVLGEDISSVALKKGADLIKQAFDNGAEIAVSVN